MPRTRIKICGISDPDHVSVIAEAGADAIGLVLVEKSPRYVEVGRAAEILAALPPYLEAVGVIMENQLESLDEELDLPLTMWQVHGQPDEETLEEMEGVRVMVGVSVIPASLSRELKLWNHLWAYPNFAGIVLDTPDASGLGGGTGETTDWRYLAETLQGLDLQVPIVLAGGLTPENVGEAIRMIRPWGVDVSSGVESTRGQKDPARIRAFCEAVRAADSAE